MKEEIKKRIGDKTECRAHLNPDSPLYLSTSSPDYFYEINFDKLSEYLSELETRIKALEKLDADEPSPSEILEKEPKETGGNLEELMNKKIGEIIELEKILWSLNKHLK